MKLNKQTMVTLLIASAIISGCSVVSKKTETLHVRSPASSSENYAGSGKLTTFVSPDGELVVEIHGKAGKQVANFFKPIDRPISKNLLRARMSTRMIKGVRAGVRTGVRVGSNLRAEAGVRAGVRTGVRVGIREDSVRYGIRAGLKRAQTAMRMARRASLRTARRVGIRETMNRMMNLRASHDDSLVYRLVFKRVSAKAMYPHTGAASIKKTGANSLRIQFDEETSEVLEAVENLRERNVKIDCNSRDACGLVFDL